MTKERSEDLSREQETRKGTGLVWEGLKDYWNWILKVSKLG